MNNYSISDISEIVKISQHTLRYYEKIGLLTGVERNSKGRRSYSENDVNLLNFINCLRSTGMPIKQIKSYLDFMRMGDATIQERKRILSCHLEFMKKQVKNFENCCKILEYKMENYEKIEAEF